MRKHFASLERTQAAVLKLSRNIIRDASRAVNSIHRGRVRTAEILIERSRRNLKKLESLLDEEGWGMFYNSLVSAQQEYAEAAILLSLLKGGDAPGFEELDVLPRAYAFALADVVGELYRVFLNRLRKRERQESEKILDKMEEIFEVLMEMDFPQSVLPGMRQRQDRVRRTVEQARRDFVMAFREAGG